MRIKFEGTPNKITLKECRQALRFYGKILFSKKGYKKVHLKTTFIDGYLKSDEAKGATDWEGMNAPLYKLELDDNLTHKETLMVLAHELVHVKQMFNGELVDTDHRTKFLYKKKSYDTAKIDYWDLPHEIEAYGREPGLYRRYYETYIKKAKRKNHSLYH